MQDAKLRDIIPYCLIEISSVMLASCEIKLPYLICNLHTIGNHFAKMA